MARKNILKSNALKFLSNDKMNESFLDKDITKKEIDNAIQSSYIDRYPKTPPVKEKKPEENKATFITDKDAIKETLSSMLIKK